MGDEKYMQKFTKGMQIAMAIKGYSNLEMSRLSGVNPTFFTRIKTTANSSNPKLSTLIKIASVFDTTIENIITLPDRAEHLLTK